MTRKLAVSLFAFFIAGLPVARAGFYNNAATALNYAGFDIQGQSNPLSGGADLLITRQFNGSLFDFGTTELTLQGPISLGVSTAYRFLPEVEFSLSTAVSPRNDASTLSYSLVTDVGPQVRSVSGSTLIDANFKINALGFYDLTLTTSSRQTIQRDGVVTNEVIRDSDVGPVVVSGHIVVDLLAAVTDPLFAESGAGNPFAKLSANLISLNDVPMVNLLSDPEAGLSSDGLRVFDSSGSISSPAPQGLAGMIVPEPPVLVLLLLGVPAILHRSLRSR